MTNTDLLTIAAILIGPIVAVLITRWVDDRRFARQRRMEIFRTLMRTRRTAMSPEYVGALNLIEIEFAGYPEVIENWKKLFTHFGSEHPRKPDEVTTGISDKAEVERRTNAFLERIGRERQSQSAKLLHSMAKAQKFRAEQLEIFEGGYILQGWVNLEADQDLIHRYVVDLYHGRRMVPVGVVDFTSRGEKNPEPESLA